MDEVLMRIVVHAAAFFELCDDEKLDPDTAVQQLESIAGELRNLDTEGREMLISYVRQEAEGARSADLRAFLLRFPETMGLSDEPE